MLTLIQDIDPVVFSKNIIPLWLQTDELVLNYGTAYSRSMNVAAVAGSTIQLIFNGNTITFTGSNTPDSSGLQFLTGAGVLHENIRDAFNANYLFSSYYTASIISGKLFIQANQVGAAYTITYGTSTATFSTITDIPGVDFSARSNFNIISEVWAENNYGSGQYKRISTQLIAPDFNQEVVFDFRKNLHALLDNAIDMPTYNMNTAAKCTQIVKRFFLKSCEQWGLPPIQRKMEIGEIKTAIRGGISLIESETHTSFLSGGYVYSYKKFLTWRPITKPVSKAQQEYLYWLLDPSYTSPISISCRVKATLTDGTVGAMQTLYVVASIAGGEVWLLPAGYNQLLAYGAFVGQDVRSYELWFGITGNAGSVLTEKMIYVIDQACFEGNRQLLFLNSMGGVDTLAIRDSSTQISTEVSRLYTEKFAAFPYSSAKGGTIRNYNNSGQQHFKVRTGLYDKQNMEYFANELLKSEAVYEAKNGRFYPVFIKTDNVVFYQETLDLYSFEFEYVEAYSETVYTPQLP